MRSCQSCEAGMCVYSQGVYLHGVPVAATPRALTNFLKIYEESVARIDVNWLVELVDFVQWDDIGARVWERAVTLASVPLVDQSKVRVRRGRNYLRPQNAHDNEPGCVKQSLSSSTSLHTQPWIVSWGKLWYDWNEHDQHPDAVFTLRLIDETDTGSMEEEILLCYECDGDSKAEKRREMRKVVMKMWQAVDAARWTESGQEKRAELSAYTVRCNVFRALKLDEPDAVKRCLAWLHQIMSAHIFSFLLIVEDWLASRSQTKVTDSNTEGLPRFKDEVTDHHLFIGLFTFPVSSYLSLAPERAWKMHEESYSKFGTDGVLTPKRFDGSQPDGSVDRTKSYVDRNTKANVKEVFSHKPLPLVKTASGNVVPTFHRKFKENWKARTTIRTWANYDVRAFSVQRVDMDKVYNWINNGDDRTAFYSSVPQGAWYLTDVRSFLLHYYRQSPDKIRCVFQAIPRSHRWEDEINKRMGSINPKRNSIKLAEDTTAVLIQNAITELETALLGAFKTDSGWGTTMLSWNVASYQKEYISESLTDAMGPLTALKKMMRDNPTLLRHRYASKGLTSWEEYNKRNGTLRSACYVKLSHDLPSLPPWWFPFTKIWWFTLPKNE